MFVPLVCGFRFSLEIIAGRRRARFEVVYQGLRASQSVSRFYTSSFSDYSNG
jgi:hypothetical protein